MSKKKKLSGTQVILSVICTIVLLIIAYFAGTEIHSLDELLEFANSLSENTITTTTNTTSYASLIDVPEYSGEDYVTINDNKPYFTESDYTTEAFEKYSELDSLGRCGVAYANICKETMPPEGDERGDIGSVKPTGWKQAKFNGEYLYNRCHLIAYSLSDEDANKKNLITGTRYFNVQGMLPFEMSVLDYMKANKNNHVLYRVTPVFKGNNLLATGVEMEAYSIEDNGKLSFNVFVYNIQPGAELNYATGELINK